MIRKSGIVALGDTLSTALFCMTLEDGQKLIESLENAEAMWLKDDKTIITTNGWNDYQK